jgi:sugar/nucleoside kinase (ribokinase family)
MAVDSVEYVIVGGLREDYFITPTGQAHLGHLGGNALYAAVGARLWSRLGSEKVGLAARVGSNFPAGWLDIIAGRGIDTAGIVVVPEPLDTRTFYAYRTLEQRDDTEPAAHFARLGLPLPAALEGYATSTEGQADPQHFSPLAVRPDELAPGYLGARAFHLAPYDFSVHLSYPGHLRAAGGIVTCDPSVRYMYPQYQVQVAKILRQLEAFLPSEMETRAFFPELSGDLWAAAEAFGALGAGCVVLKLGAQGQYVYEPTSGLKWHVPAYPAKVVDVTGAGDAYCGGFLVGLEQTGDPLEAALRGCVAASLVVEGLGALYALDQPPRKPAERLAELRPAVRRA